MNQFLAQDAAGGDAGAQHGDQFGGDAGGDFEGGQGFGDQQMNQEYIEAQRNKLWGCFFLAKHKLYSVNNELQEIFTKSKDKSQTVYKKIIGELFEKCISKIQVEEGQKVRPFKDFFNG
jgi:hypothetical protein